MTLSWRSLVYAAFCSIKCVCGCNRQEEGNQICESFSLHCISLLSFFFFLLLSSSVSDRYQSWEHIEKERGSGPDCLFFSPILHRTNSLFSSKYSAQLNWGLIVIWLPVGNIAAYSIYSCCPQPPNWLPPLFTILHDSLKPVTKSATVSHGLLVLLWKSVAKRVLMSRSVQDSVMRYSLISTVG